MAETKRDTEEYKSAKAELDECRRQHGNTLYQLQIAEARFARALKRLSAEYAAIFDRPVKD